MEPSSDAGIAQAVGKMVMDEETQMAMDSETPEHREREDYNPLKDFKGDFEKDGWRKKIQLCQGGDASAELRKSVMWQIKPGCGPEQYKGTGLIYDELFTQHQCEWDPKFPECPERILAPYARCQELGLIERCVQIPINHATEEQLQWQHTAKHVELAKMTAKMTPQQRKEFAKKYDSWFACEATFDCGCAAAGSCIHIVDHILKNKVTNGFAMVRPPGHHAMQEEFCGYCTFNNVAFAATHALNCGVERVLIVDWDVHHGQGTQRMFYDDPRVLYFSIHRYEHGTYWPHLRESDYDFSGEGPGKGYNVNVPLNQTGLGDSDYMAVMQQLLMPLAYEFNPEVVLVSCGLDAAIGDEKGEMKVTPAAYAHFIHMLSPLCEGRLCVVLEGGYCLKSLSEGCALIIRALLGDPCPQLPPMSQPSDSTICSILNVVKVLRPHWRCYDTFRTLKEGEVCTFQEVNTMPPKEGVVFRDVSNAPAEYDVMGHFPQQDPDTIAELSSQIDQLIAETSLTKPQHRTCFVFDPAMMRHRNFFDVTHPERPNRIFCIHEKHCEWKLLDRCLQQQARRATEEEILRAHSESYLAIIKGVADSSEEKAYMTPHLHMFPSIYMCKDTYDCALLAAGGALQATEAVLSGQTQNAVAIIRPPGHHAEADRAMGFCFFNNVALAAHHAKKKFGIKRVLIVDWDVHHGNATQHMFYDDPSVVYVSVHRYERAGRFFPGHREADLEFTGEGQGTGFNVNVPWPCKNMGNAEIMAAFQKIVMPIAYEFGPELVLVSAGFDAAEGDLLGECSVMPECFGHLTHMLSSLANGRIVLILEGGYNLDALALSMTTCTSVLLGDPCPPLNPGIPKRSARETIRKVLEEQQQYWKSLRFAVGIPSIGGEPEESSSDEELPSPGDKRHLLPPEEKRSGSGDSGQAVGEAAGSRMQSGDGQAGQPAETKQGTATAAAAAATQKDGEAEAGPSGREAGTAGGSGGEEVLGACGGSSRPATVADILHMQGVDQLYTVQPRQWCPHLTSVRPLPPEGLDITAPCTDCGDPKENWVCLVCYKVFCSRYVQEHMLFHSLAEEHMMVLSYSDLSVWCYACDDYIDNQVTFPMKSAAHHLKFGEPLPGGPGLSH